MNPSQLLVAAGPSTPPIFPFQELLENLGVVEDVASEHQKGISGEYDLDAQDTGIHPLTMAQGESEECGATTPPFALLGGDQVLSSAFGLVDSSLVCEGPPPLQPLIPFEGHQDSGWVGKGERQGLEIQVKRTHSQNNMGAVPGTGETPLRVAASNTLFGFEKGSLKEVEKGVGKIFSSVSSWFGGRGPPLKFDGPAPRGQPQPYSHSTQSSSHSSQFSIPFNPPLQKEPQGKGPVEAQWVEKHGPPLV